MGDKSSSQVDSPDSIMTVVERRSPVCASGSCTGAVCGWCSARAGGWVVDSSVMVRILHYEPTMLRLGTRI